LRHRLLDRGGRRADRVGRRGVRDASAPARAACTRGRRRVSEGVAPRLYTRTVGSGKTYAAAGVSLSTAEAVVERLRAAVESTGAEGFGAFAGLYPLDERRLLAASTDSVGTKLILARERGRLRACGADLAAHCINDVLTTGAEPLFLLDYVAASAI